MILWFCDFMILLSFCFVSFFEKIRKVIVGNLENLIFLHIVTQSRLLVSVK